MAEELDPLAELEKTIDGAIADFNDKIPDHEQRIYADILELLKDLKTKNGRVLNTVDNLKLIIKLRTKIKRILANKDYIKDVKKFTEAFNTVTDIQNGYFAQFGGKFGSKTVADIVKTQTIDMTTAYLIEGGINQVLLPKVEEILRTSITTGGTYAEMTNTLREFIVKTDNEGALERYARQITTDAINQYSRNYNYLISQDLGFEWYVYRNSLIDTSRDFCIQCVKKRWIHKSEIPTLLKGNIDGVKVPIYDKTGLPQGMYPGTNPANFHVYAGGYNCGHQVQGVPSDIVPEIAKSNLGKADNKIKTKEVEKTKQKEPYSYDQNIKNVIDGKPNVISVYDYTKSVFEKNGYVVKIGADSKTDWGHSKYMYISKTNDIDATRYKVRVSDHSVTNINRIFDEFHIDNRGIGINKALLDIDFKLKPELFTKRDGIIEIIKEIEVPAVQNENAIIQNAYNKEIDTILGERTTKKGNVLYTVSRKIKQEVEIYEHKITGETIVINK